MKHINLTQNEKTIIDDEDYDFISQYRWHAHNGYADRKIRNFRNEEKVQHMHREIMRRQLQRDLMQVEEVDHINGNTFDNRRCNLRIATRLQNCANRTKQKTYKGKKTTSKYKGVSWHRVTQKWRADIRVQTKRLWLGIFEDEIEAAQAYDQAAKKYFGEFAKLNFKEYFE